MITRSGRFALLVAFPLVALAGCGLGGDDFTAGAVCGQFVDQRVGAELEHEAARGVGEDGGPWTVTSRYTAPDTRQVVSYTCTVQRVDDGWQLVDLQLQR